MYFSKYLKKLGSIAFLLSGLYSLLFYKKTSYKTYINNECIREKCLMIVFGICKYGIITNKNQSALEKLLLWIRGNFFIPDARIGWVKPAVGFLKEYLAKNDMDIVISSGPPHSLHLIGMALKEELGIKWVADFRDPWTTIHYHQSLRLNKPKKKILYWKKKFYQMQMQF